MSKYKVLTPIDHDGKRYEPGKPIELDDEQAKPLLAVGAIAGGKGKAEEPANPVNPENPAD